MTAEVLKLAKKVRDERDPYARLELLRQLAELVDLERARQVVDVIDRDGTHGAGRRLGVSHQAAAQQRLRAVRRLRKADT